MGIGIIGIVITVIDTTGITKAIDMDISVGTMIVITKIVDTIAGTTGIIANTKKCLATHHS